MGRASSCCRVCCFRQHPRFSNIPEAIFWGNWMARRLGSICLRHDVFASRKLSRNISITNGVPALSLLVCNHSAAGPDGSELALAIGALGFGLPRAAKQGCDTKFSCSWPSPRCLHSAWIYSGSAQPCVYLLVFFCGVTLFCLEELPAAPLAGGRCAGHAGLDQSSRGFVVGLGVVFFYAAAAVFLRKDIAPMAGTATACALVTLINPYGVKFWQYLIPRCSIRARALRVASAALLAWDDFLGFRLLFVLTVRPSPWAGNTLPGRIFAASPSCADRRPWAGAPASRPAFRRGRLAFAGPYYASLAFAQNSISPGPFHPLCGLAFFAALGVLPKVSAQLLRRLGEDPVREADILAGPG